MIFLIIGSQKFQFNRLLEEVDKLVKEGIIDEEVIAQIGCSDYIPKNYQYKNYLNREEFQAIMEKCTLVISHGGSGAIVGAVKKGKKVIAVPRLKKYGEHVDDHQIQIIEQFTELRFIYGCCDCGDLSKALNTVKEIKFQKYTSNTSSIINSIQKYIDGNN